MNSFIPYKERKSGLLLKFPVFFSIMALSVIEFVTQFAVHDIGNTDRDIDDAAKIFLSSRKSMDDAKEFLMKGRDLLWNAFVGSIYELERLEGHIFQEVMVLSRDICKDWFGFNHMDSKPSTKGIQQVLNVGGAVVIVEDPAGTVVVIDGNHRLIAGLRQSPHPVTFGARVTRIRTQVPLIDSARMWFKGHHNRFVTSEFMIAEMRCYDRFGEVPN